MIRALDINKIKKFEENARHAKEIEAGTRWNLKQESRLVSLGYTVIYLGYDGNPGFGYLEC